MKSAVLHILADSGCSEICCTLRVINAKKKSNFSKKICLIRVVGPFPYEGVAFIELRAFHPNSSSEYSACDGKRTCAGQKSKHGNRNDFHWNTNWCNASTFKTGIFEPTERRFPLLSASISIVRERAPSPVMPIFYPPLTSQFY